jgi:hypothetical protein
VVADSAAGRAGNGFGARRAREEMLAKNSTGGKGLHARGPRVVAPGSGEAARGIRALGGAQAEP